MTRSDDTAAFSISRKGYDRTEVDEHLSSLESQLAEQISRVEELEATVRSLEESEAELRDADVAIGELRREVTSYRQRISELEEELVAARDQEDAVRLMLAEAKKTRDRMIADGTELLADSSRQAQEEAARIIEQALDKAVTIKEAARDDARAVEDRARLETERLQLMYEIYRELEATLQLVATTSIDDLLEARKALEQLDLDSGDEPDERLDGHEEPEPVAAEAEAPVEEPATAVEATPAMVVPPPEAGEPPLPHIGDDAAREAVRTAMHLRDSMD